MTLLVLVFSIDVGAIEDCVFGGLKLGSESSVDQVFKWVVHVLWRCENFFSGWHGSNVLAYGTAISKGSALVLVGGGVIVS